MCGIVGCAGHGNAHQFVGEGLTSLEYRGYDSAGISFVDTDTSRLKVIRKLGSVSELIANLPPNDERVTTAIGHTRWATHGVPSVRNAHPQVSTDRRIAVVHNGTIENYRDLQDELKALGYAFRSETDTEVIPHLLDHYLEEGMEPDEAFTSAMTRLHGAYAILGSFAIEPDTIYAARVSSPLVLGVRGDERFAASAQRAILPKSRWLTFMDDNEVARLSADPRRYATWHIESRRNTTRPPQELTDELKIAELGDYPNFMLKEIYETPETVLGAISGRVDPRKGTIKLGGLENNDEHPEIEERLARMERLVIVACGSSYHAGLIGKLLIEEIAGIPVEVKKASEFQYRPGILDRDTAVLGISQSGETADTVGALRKAQDHKLLTLGINNSPTSTIDRMTDAGIHCRADEEISVASTKAYVSMLTVLTELAVALSKEEGPLNKQIAKELVDLPDKIRQILNNTEEIKAAAKKYAKFTNFLYIGRGYEEVSAIEGALKLKEISQIHAEGISAGEMKHGTLALINRKFPTFAIATNSPVYEKTLSNISEIKSRKGPVIALVTEGNTAIKGLVDDALYVPASLEQTQPILNAIVMQLFAYYVAVEKGTDIDRPRNLAKSVTVE